MSLNQTPKIFELHHSMNDSFPFVLKALISIFNRHMLNENIRLIYNSVIILAIVLGKSGQWCEIMVNIYFHFLVIQVM